MPKRIRAMEVAPGTWLRSIDGTDRPMAIAGLLYAAGTRSCSIRGLRLAVRIDSGGVTNRGLLRTVRVPLDQVDEFPAGRRRRALCFRYPARS
jgi:hypothetical protein